MTDLASTDVTYTINENHILNGGQRLVEATLAFGDAALTYPAGGLALLKGKFGFKKRIISVTVIESNVSGLKWEFDISAVKLRALEQNATTGATAVTGAGSDGALIVNSAGTEVSARLISSATSTSYALGKLAELGNIAVAATSLRVEARGY